MVPEPRRGSYWTMVSVDTLVLLGRDIDPRTAQVRHRAATTHRCIKISLEHSKRLLEGHASLPLFSAHVRQVHSNTASHDLMDYQLLGIVILNTLLHELGVPIPLAPTVLAAGASAVSGGTSALQLIAAIVIATLLGNSIWFAAGRRYGSRTLRFLSHATLSPEVYMTRVQHSFGRWESSAIVVGRFIPGMSLLTPPLAGALGMSWGRFIVLSATGAALWGFVFVGIGMLLHDQLDAAMRMLYPLGGKLLAVIILVIASYIAWRVLERRRLTRKLNPRRTQVDEPSSPIDRRQPPHPVHVLTSNNGFRC